jgi:hypothetical protein
MKSTVKKTPELKGILLSTVILIILAFTGSLPEWLQPKNAWLAVLICIAIAVVTFVIIMYKKVNKLKQ